MAVGDDIVVDCYRLARWYHQNPAVFLDMPLSEILLHVTRSIQMARLQRQSVDDDGD